MSKKYEKKDLQHPVDYNWKTEFDYFWNTKSDQKNWILPKVLKDQATKKIQNLKKDLFNIRFKRINNQINNTAQYNEIKKDIARLYTTIRNTK